MTSFASLCLSALIALAPGGSQPKDEITTPPGLVDIKGGRTQIGTSVKVIEGLMEGSSKMLRAANALAAETPSHTVDVDDYALMVTEVTNEQYRAFVEAAGGQPPQHWGQASIDKAGREFLETQGKARQAAREAGEPVPEAKVFERERWWAKNWATANWEVPDGEELNPVVYVNYANAQAYARWAGLRLMSEEEYQRAGRDNSDNTYPWGDDWDDDKYCATNAQSENRNAFAVASFPEGKSPSGIFDLSGNVWEWTSTGYRGYPKFKIPTFEVGKGSRKTAVEGIPTWDSNQRVAVGGSFSNPPTVARITTRRPTDRTQSTEALGFRCAASADPGRDMAAWALKDIPVEARPEDVAWSTAGSVAMERWDSKGPSKTKVGRGQTLPDEYRVITGYSSILFVPVEKILDTSTSALEKRSLKDGPQHLGVLTTTLPILEPELEPGTYMLAWRAKGDDPKPEKGEDAEADATEAEPTAAEQLGFDTETAQFIFYDSNGTPVRARPAGSLGFSRLKPGAVTFEDHEFKVMVEEEEVTQTEKWVHFALGIQSRLRGKGLTFTLELKIDPAELERDWRR
ncbi:MAG: formylglycine-generating enzyme family protein [Planctomycetota bacterium]|nr:formylglycine-generating enzyme family protein [Planctomycetota bacterium]